MAYEQRDNSGSLFKNDKKQEGDSKPNMSGKAMIDGVMYFFDAWTKTTGEGKKCKGSCRDSKDVRAVIVNGKRIDFFFLK